MNIKTAFIGLGKMGGAIAANVVKSGVPLTVWNRSPEKCAALEALGAAVASTPADAVRDADLVITSLMDDRSILDVLEGEHGVLAGLKPGATHACVTTISPRFAEQLSQIHAECGSRYVSAPVIGRPNAAEAAQLVSYLAGDAEGIEIARQVASTYSRAVHVLPGSAGVANSLKLALNYSVISLIELFGEVYNFAEASGVDPQAVGDFFETAFKHPVLLYYSNKIMNREFDSAAGFAMTAGLKDVTLMLDAAQDAGVRLEIGEIASQRLKAAIAEGMGAQDWSAMTELTRK